MSNISLHWKSEEGKCKKGHGNKGDKRKRVYNFGMPRYCENCTWLSDTMTPEDTFRAFPHK